MIADGRDYILIDGKEITIWSVRNGGWRNPRTMTKSELKSMELGNRTVLGICPSRDGVLIEPKRIMELTNNGVQVMFIPVAFRDRYRDLRRDSHVSVRYTLLPSGNIPRPVWYLVLKEKTIKTLPCERETKRLFEKIVEDKYFEDTAKAFTQYIIQCVCKQPEHTQNKRFTLIINETNDGRYHQPIEVEQTYDPKKRFWNLNYGEYRVEPLEVLKKAMYITEVGGVMVSISVTGRYIAVSERGGDWREALRTNE